MEALKQWLKHTVRFTKDGGREGPSPDLSTAFWGVWIFEACCCIPNLDVTG